MLALSNLQHALLINFNCLLSPSKGNFASILFDLNSPVVMFVHVSQNILILRILAIAALVWLALPTSYVAAQNGDNGRFITITVSAQIQSTVEIETRNNINLGRVSPGQEFVTINPREDPGAGLLRVSGSPGMLFRVSFQETRELVRIGGGRNLMFTYDVSGAQTDNQLLSEPITRENRDLRMSDDGEFFFWVGGTLDLQGDIFGQYEGEFTIEVDFI